MLYELVEILFKLCFNIVVAIIIIIASVSVIALVLYLVSKCCAHCSKDTCDGDSINAEAEKHQNESTFWILKRDGVSYLCDKKPIVVVSEGKEVYWLRDNSFYIGTEWFSEVKEENKPVRITIKIEEE
jgi:hypothetical protein